MASKLLWDGNPNSFFSATVLRSGADFVKFFWAQVIYLGLDRRCSELLIKISTLRWLPQFSGLIRWCLKLAFELWSSQPLALINKIVLMRTWKVFGKSLESLWKEPIGNSAPGNSGFLTYLQWSLIWALACKLKLKLFQAIVSSMVDYNLLVESLLCNLEPNLPLWYTCETIQKKTII